MMLSRVRKSSKRSVFFLAIFFLSIPGFKPCSAAAPEALDRSKALVSIESVNALGRTEDKTGMLGGAAVLFLNKNPARLVKYSRGGSGVIIDPRGIIVTNAHIVQGAAGISVKLFNGKRYEGRIIYAIPESDIAYLSIKSLSSLPYVPMANSDKVVRGARVYCIGHALNHSGSLFGGEVSAVKKQPVSRGFRTTLLQVRFGFHLYGGDSGSPILNQKGHLVGLVSAGRRSGDMATLVIASNVIRDGYWNIPKY